MKKIIIAGNIKHAIGAQESFFDRKNIATHVAHTSEELLTLHRTHEADIIITDVDLPLMGGLKLCSSIRSDERLRPVAILMVCDNVASLIIQCREAGANVVLPRPLDAPQLIWKVSELLLVPQRQDIRTLLHVTVKGRERNAAFLGISHNISISGLLLESDCILAAGDQLTCTFEIGRREIVAMAEVKRPTRLSSGKFLYGVKFMNLDTKTLILIEQYVKGGVKH